MIIIYIPYFGSIFLWTPVHFHPFELTEALTYLFCNCQWNAHRGALARTTSTCAQLSLSRQRDILLSAFSIKTFYAYLISPVRAACSTHHISSRIVTLTVCGKQYRSRRFEFCNYSLSRHNSASSNVIPKQCQIYSRSPLECPKEIVFAQTWMKKNRKRRDAFRKLVANLENNRIIYTDG